MRKIKFRAKRKDTNTWVYGDLYGDCEDQICYIRSFGSASGDCGPYNYQRDYIVDENTIGMYACTTLPGITINGEDIYEGDVISNNHFGGDKDVFREVVFEDCKFKAKRIKGKASSIPDDLFSIKDLNFEVIGNIYDGITKESRYCQKKDDVISKEVFKKPNTKRC